MTKFKFILDIHDKKKKESKMILSWILPNVMSLTSQECRCQSITFTLFGAKPTKSKNVKCHRNPADVHIAQFSQICCYVLFSLTKPTK